MPARCAPGVLLTRNWQTVPMLIALAGLPGTGKTSIARTLAAEFGAVHLRIDAIETVLHREGTWSDEHPAIAYEIAAELAADQPRGDVDSIGGRALDHRRVRCARKEHAGRIRWSPQIRCRTRATRSG